MFDIYKFLKEIGWNNQDAVEACNDFHKYYNSLSAEEMDDGANLNAGDILAFLNDNVGSTDKEDHTEVAKTMLSEISMEFATSYSGATTIVWC